MCKVNGFFSRRLVINGDLNFFSLTISYISGIRGFDFLMMLFNPVLIDLGVRYFDAMCATVYCFVCYQSHFGKINIEVTRF